MLLGYNTNGFAHHDLAQAIELLAEFGYKSVAITLDHGALNPFDPRLDAQLDQIRTLLERYQLRSVIETGARYLLDPRRKHEPTLVTADADLRRRRVDFYARAIALAKQLQSDCVSLWSGIAHDRGTSAGQASDDVVWPRLIDGLRQVLDIADSQKVKIGFEPEPGMFIDTMACFDELTDRLGVPIPLTLDLGHLHCQGEPIVETIRDYAPRLVNVHIEDMRRGVHEHLMFGEGEMDFPPILAALAEHYRGGVHVELSRHSHAAPDAAGKSFEFLTRAIG